MPIRREVSDHRGEAAILNNIEEVYRSIGQPQKALSYYKPALSISREGGDRATEATILSNIGVVYRGRNQPSEAIDIWEQSIAITLEMRGGLLRENRKQFLEAKRGRDLKKSAHRKS